MRYGVLSLLCVATVIAYVQRSAVGVATGLPGLLLLWGLMGCAQAGIFPCSTKAIGALFPATERAFASGMLACCMAMGWAVAPLITAWYLTFVSWQTTFALYA